MAAVEAMIKQISSALLREKISYWKTKQKFSTNLSWFGYEQLVGDLNYSERCVCRWSDGYGSVDTIERPVTKKWVPGWASASMARWQWWRGQYAEHSLPLRENRYDNHRTKLMKAWHQSERNSLKKRNILKILEICKNGTWPRKGVAGVLEEVMLEVGLKGGEGEEYFRGMGVWKSPVAGGRA